MGLPRAVLYAIVGWCFAAGVTLLASTCVVRAAPLPVINGNGQQVFMNTIQDTAGNYSNRNVFCDGSNPDVCASVNGSGQLSVLASQPTAANLNATVVQGNPNNLVASVVQPTGTLLHTVVDSCTGCGGSSGTGLADESVFTAGTSLQLLAGCFYQTTATSNGLLTGTQGAIQCTSNRAVFSNLRDSSANELGIAANPLQVTLANTGSNSTPVVTTSTLNQAGSALSTTNGLYTNLLQSNAVIAAGNPIYTTNVPLTTGGLSIKSVIVPNNTTSVAVGTSAAHQLYGIDAFSISSATPVYVKVYNATQGSTTCGSGTPVGRYAVPASGGVTGSGFIMHEPNGVAFSTALTYCVTGGIADNDTTAPAASSYILNIYYK